MGDRFTYLFLCFVFFTPVFLILCTFFRKTIKKSKKLILLSIPFAVTAFFIIDLSATEWGAWGFDYTKTLGILFGKSVIEELLWFILVCMVLAIVVSICAEIEEKK